MRAPLRQEGLTASTASWLSEAVQRKEALNRSRITAFKCAAVMECRVNSALAGESEVVRKAGSRVAARSPRYFSIAMVRCPLPVQGEPVPMNFESTGKRSVKAPLAAVDDRVARRSAVYKLKLSCREGMSKTFHSTRTMQTAPRRGATFVIEACKSVCNPSA